MTITLSLQVSGEGNYQEREMAVAAVLFKKGSVSSGQAAEFAGVTKRYFIENVGSYGISIFDEDSLKSNPAILDK